MGVKDAGDNLTGIELIVSHPAGNRLGGGHQHPGGDGGREAGRRLHSQGDRISGAPVCFAIECPPLDVWAGHAVQCFRIMDIIIYFVETQASRVLRLPSDGDVSLGHLGQFFSRCG